MLKYTFWSSFTQAHKQKDTNDNAVKQSWFLQEQLTDPTVLIAKKPP